MVPGWCKPSEGCTAGDFEPARAEVVAQLGGVGGQVTVSTDLDPLVPAWTTSSRKRSAGVWLGSSANQMPQESGAVPMTTLLVTTRVAPLLVGCLFGPLRRGRTRTTPHANSIAWRTKCPLAEEITRAAV